MDLVDEANELGWTAERFRRTYNAMHTHPSMSLYVSSHSFTSTFEHVLGWFDRNVVAAPETFMDVGCGNGLLTLCLSDLWPEARGYGIDQLGKAISVAESLAKRFNNERVSFFQGDLAHPGAVESIAPTSMVLATFVFHELLDEPIESWHHISENVDALMKGSGRLISINRFPDPPRQVPSLNRRLGLAGLRPTGEDSLKAGDETFPVVIYEKV